MVYGSATGASIDDLRGNAALTTCHDTHTHTRILVRSPTPLPRVGHPTLLVAWLSGVADGVVEGNVGSTWPR